MNLLDFTLPGSDPNAPNTFVQTPEQIAMRQALAQKMMQEGSSYAPVQSAWQGAARLAQALTGAIGNYKAMQGQRLGLANAGAEFGSALGLDPGEQSIPATPGQTTPALQASDAKVDAESAAEDAASGNGGVPNPALAAAMGGGGGASTGNMALASAMGAPAPSGGSLMAPTVAPTNTPIDPNAYPNTQQGHEAYIRARAASLGLDPNFAVSVASAEGLRALSPQNPNAGSYVDRNADGTPFSYGDFQLNVRNGLGNVARAQGIDPTNPNDWQRADDFALNTMAKGGLGPWKGDKAVEAYRAGNPGAPPPAVAAINAVTSGGYGGPMAHSADGSPIPTDAQGYAINPATGQRAAVAPQPAPAPLAGAGAPPAASAPSQADMSTLARAMQPQSGGGLGIIGSANAAPAPNAALAAASGLNAPIAAASPVAPPAAAPPPQAPAPAQGASAPPAPQAPLQAAPMVPQGIHPNIQALMSILSDPWATPAQQQIASTLLSAQMPTPPTFGVIGKDVAGNEQYGWINPKAQTVTPAGLSSIAGAGGALPPVAGATTAPSAPSPSGAGSNVAGETANGLTPQGSQYLEGMEGQGGAGAVVARAARAIINGQAPLPEANAATKPIDIAIRDAVFRAAPGYNSSIAAAKNKAVIDMADTSSPQSPGGLMLNLNGALGHAGALSDSSRSLAADQYGNNSHGPNTLINWVGNELGGKDHQEKLAAYNANARTFVDEAIKFYQGSGGTELDRENMLKELSPNAAPDVRDAAIAKYVNLLKDKGQSLQEKWGQAAPGGLPYPVIGRQGAAAAASVLARDPLAAPVAVAPPGAVTMLKGNPTPQMRQHFDEVFGPGASDKALAQ